MATMKVIQCREHGGTFTIPSRRGRPPVKCSDENPCDMVRPRVRRTVDKSNTPTAAQKGRPTPRPGSEAAAKRTAETLKGKMPTKSRPNQRTRDANRETVPASAPEVPKRAPRKRREAAPVVVRHNPSIPMAHHARELLAPLDWDLKGRAWFVDDEAWAEVTGARGTETIVLQFRDGKMVTNHYSLWDSDATGGQNGKPRSRLPFNPHEMTDLELVRELSGRSVTWWNRLRKGTENAAIGDKLEIQHNYTGGNEIARMVKFCDKGNGGFRAFYVDALMRVK